MRGQAGRRSPGRSEPGALAVKPSPTPTDLVQQVQRVHGEVKSLAIAVLLMLFILMGVLLVSHHHKEPGPPRSVNW
jgi:hypothetical protein